MALAATHIIGAIFILDLFRHYLFGKKQFPRYLLIVGGIAGLGPDIDIPLTWLINFVTGNNSNFHGTFTHSFLFVLIFFGIGALFHSKKKMKWAKIFYVIAAGWFIHLGLDWLFGEYKLLFWPFATPKYIFPQTNLWIYSAEIDAIVLVLWLLHEELHKRIRDYF